MPCFWDGLVNAEKSCFGATLLTDGTIQITEKDTGLSGNISQDEISQTVKNIFIDDACDQSGIISYLDSAGYIVDAGEVKLNIPPSDILGVTIILVAPFGGLVNGSSYTASFVISSLTAAETYYDGFELQKLSTSYRIWGTLGGVRLQNKGNWYWNEEPEHDPLGGIFPVSDPELYTAITPFLNGANLYSMLTDCSTGELYDNIKALLS